MPHTETADPAPAEPRMKQRFGPYHIPPSTTLQQYKTERRNAHRAAVCLSSLFLPIAHSVGTPQFKLHERRARTLLRVIQRFEFRYGMTRHINTDGRRYFTYTRYSE